MSYRSEFFARVANGRNVLDIALDVHMRVTGSSEFGNDKEFLDDIHCLGEVLADWSPSYESHEYFDDAVRQVVRAAYTEGRAHAENLKCHSRD